MISQFIASRAPEKEELPTPSSTISSPFLETPYCDHSLESSRRDDSNEWSQLGFWGKNINFSILANSSCQLTGNPEPPGLLKSVDHLLEDCFLLPEELFVNHLFPKNNDCCVSLSMSSPPPPPQ